MQESEGLKIKSIFGSSMIWLILFILPLLFYPWVINSSWVSNSDIHAILEFWAATTALIVAAVVLINFFANGRRFFLFISLGFTIQGAEDLVHAIYSFVEVWPVGQSGFVDFLPGTYVAGRLILAVCFLLALFFENSIAKNKIKEAVFYNFSGFVFSVIITLSIIGLPLPHFISSGQFISRPVDFAAGLFYSIALLLFIGVYLKKENKTPFVWAMIVSIIFGLVAQVYMVHSQSIFDAQFTIAHLIKILSYIFPIFGISVGIFKMYKKEELTARGLASSINKERRIMKELQKSSLNLGKLNKIMVGREIQMIELKKKLQRANDEIIELRKK